MDPYHFGDGRTNSGGVPGAGSVSSEQTSRTTRTSRSSRSAAYVANKTSTAINKVISLVDIDGMVRRVDFNDIVNRVDWNDVIDDIDWNNLLEHIDVDALMHRIDVNAVVERIDVNALIERSNLKSIIARSTSGICFMAMDSFRAMCIKADQLLQRLGRCADCCFCYPDYSRWTLPPLPSVTPLRRRKERHKDRKLRRSMACPRKSTHLAIAVQGRCAGTCTRFIAFGIDKGIIIGMTFLTLLIVNSILSAIVRAQESTSNINAGVAATTPPKHSNSTSYSIGTFDTNNINLTDGTITNEEVFLAVVLPIILVAIFGFMFDSLCYIINGRTIGKMIMGIMVVDSRDGKVASLSICQAFWRSALNNLWFLIVLGTLTSLVRDDRRSLNDLICGTTVIYAWDAKRYRLAEEDLTRDMPFGDLESQRVAANNQRRDSIIATMKKRTAFHRGKGSASTGQGVTTRMITVPVMGDDTNGDHHSGLGKVRDRSQRMETRLVTVPIMDDDNNDDNERWSGYDFAT